MPWQRFCQQSETFDEDDLYEATTRLRRRPAGIVIGSLRSQCAFHRELVEVAALDQKLKSLGQNSAVEFNQRLLDLMQTSKET
jgi:hypothetical protein